MLALARLRGLIRYWLFEVLAETLRYWLSLHSVCLGGMINPAERAAGRGIVPVPARLWMGREG